MTSGGEVVFKKYSVLNDLSENATQCAQVLSKITGCGVAISDRSCIIAVAGMSEKDIIYKNISSETNDLLETRKSYTYSNSNCEKLYPIIGSDKYAIACIPIITSEEEVGTIMLFPTSRSQFANLNNLTVVEAMAMFLAKLIDE